ncbi:glycogen synthase GlgA [Paenibacillus senegalensis]|uniref:glycogen synthase GlgA n=1 Tax=Paenibacillus senegalensis TaxID=1465766 RepID=UPI000289E8E0|nr:glycogen synthase GlgA [Paenibacillus senegalensis]
MNIVFAASESTPFIKTGGLADVVGSLPHALRSLGSEVCVILPKYEDIPENWKARMERITEFTISIGWRNQYCGLQRVEVNGLVYYFIDNEFYFRRKGIYGYGDDAERFVFFSRAVAASLPHLDMQPDVVHCHDWQTALVPFCIKVHHQGQPFYEKIRTVFTIHNLQYQGRFSKEWLQDLIGVGDDFFALDGLEFYGDGSCMKAGLFYADLLTTVSKTYAEEIQTPAYGEQLDGVLRHRSNVLHGIVNGIDNDSYDPMKDEALYVPYRNSQAKKQMNKVKLQQELGLPERVDVPMIGMVSRLVEQKGLDLIECVLDEILRLDIQWVVLGTGDWRYEQLFRDAASCYPEKLAALIQFDDAMSRKIYAASDLFLMPSRFEPCGLGQLIALRYRSAPIVRETGGLKDTVQAYNEFTGMGTGFSFANFNAHDMLYTIERAVSFYHERPELWSRLLKNISKTDYDWGQSAKKYLELYQSLQLQTVNHHQAGSAMAGSAVVGSAV